MSYTDNEFFKFVGKVLAAGVIDSDLASQWYEAHLNYAVVTPADQLWLETDRLRNLPAADRATAVANAAANPDLIEDLSDPSDAVHMTPHPFLQQTYVAYATFNDTSSGTLANWIKPSFAPQSNAQTSNGYAVRLFDGDPAGGGTEVFTSDGQTGSGDTTRVAWFYNYDLGLLFLADDFFSGSSLDAYINGFRYVGATPGTTSLSFIQNPTPPAAAATSAITLDAGQEGRFDTSGGPIAQSLPAASDLESGDFLVVKETTGTPGLSLVPDGSDTIDGSTDPISVAGGGSSWLVCDGISNWDRLL